ncbi:hypothetical protein ACJVDH_08115 [Pedobacter sp. AW1-32]|uniref:hypothetical protein n=1 Tax=Pedobacter sp. AW1-32 TaxID=3383026 RepID=UPI003FEECC62
MDVLPEKTVIKYSSIQIIWLIASPSILIGSIFLLLACKSILQFFLAGVGCCVGVLLTFFNWMDIKELKKPLLTIDKIGIVHQNGQRFSWFEITSQNVVYLGKYQKVAHLELETHAGKRLFKMENWNKTPEAVLDIMRRYSKLQ